MDMQQLEIFTNLIKGLIVQNQDYAQQIVSLDNALEAVNSKVKVFENSEKEYFAKIKELENKYMDEIMTLKDNILNLKKENSEKSSKTIWETTQNKIKEKDEQIEELKRTIEFYKRTHNVLVGTTPEVKPEIKEVKPEIKEVPKQKRKTKTTIKTSDINEDEIIIQPVVPPKPTKTTKNIKKPEIKESQIIQKTVIKEESECSEDELERRLMGL